MDHTSTTTDTLDQAGEEILTTTVSDEALEAAAGKEKGGLLLTGMTLPHCCFTAFINCR